MQKGSVFYSCVKVKAKGKQGILKPDGKGYYTILLGALNAYNSAGHYYTLQGAKQLFDSSSTLMRRIANGCVKSELGHPKMLPGMSEDQYINRLLQIEETNVIAHIAEIWLDENFGKEHPEYNNPEMVAIYGRICPSGPHAHVLERALQNGEEDVCFSVRSFTRDYYQRNIRMRVIDELLTFDYVTEPGINIARKFDTPSLENMSLDAWEVTEKLITKAKLSSLVERPEGIGNESSNDFARGLLRSMEKEIFVPKAKIISSW